MTATATCSRGRSRRGRTPRLTTATPVPRQRENRLYSVTVNGQTTIYTYDADGARVKKAEGGSGLTTVYVSQRFEKVIYPTTSTYYYFLGGQRVAVKKAGTLTYLLTDHLGSTSVVTNQSGGIVAQQLYKPWGESRWISGTLPTDRRFTGQRSEEATLGSLYDYGARTYSPRLGRFLSADTLVPSPGDPQSLNRYAYVRNNPLWYTDSTGHCGPLTPVCLGLLLGGMALLLQDDSPDLNITPEDVASQRLGGALVVSGAILAAGGALAGTVSAARVGTTATTAACADGHLY